MNSKKGQTRKVRRNDNQSLREVRDMFNTKEKDDYNFVIKTLQEIKVNKDIKFKTKKQKELEKAIIDNEVIFVSGPPGTGKTFIALKTAIEVLIKSENPFNGILLTKPIVEAGENIGFLPGDIESKTDPYMNSFISNMSILIGKYETNNLVNAGIVKSNPLAYLRGDTFRDCIAILDEAQNTTVGGLKLWLSRKGETSKLIVLGDIDQTDLKLHSSEKSGLEDAMERFKGIENIGFVEFDEDDIVRSTILIKMMKRYNKK